jgi:hypothetical protein
MLLIPWNMLIKIHIFLPPLVPSSLCFDTKVVLVVQKGLLSIKAWYKLCFFFFSLFFFFFLGGKCFKRNYCMAFDSMRNL